MSLDFVVTPSAVKLTLWEIQNGFVGESHVRAYAWAETEDEALKLFHAMNPGQEGSTITVLPLFPLDAKPFCTKLSDSGWET